MDDGTRRRGSVAWDPATKPIRAWTALSKQAHTDEERACIAAATRQADRLWIALHSGTLGPKTPVIPLRNAAWHRVALSEFEVLRESGAYGHLAQLRPLVCAAAEPVIVAWLNSPAAEDPINETGTPRTVADLCGVGAAVNRINGDTHLSHLSALLSAAQDASVFGVPHHRVDLVAAAGHRVEGTVARVVVDTPGGLALASAPLHLDVLIDGNAAGVEGAAAALRRVASVATGLFDGYARAVWESPPPMPIVDRGSTPAGRAFPELALGRRPAPAVSPLPPAAATGPARPADADRSARGSR